VKEQREAGGRSQALGEAECGVDHHVPPAPREPFAVRLPSGATRTFRIALIDARPPQVELVITGRVAPRWLIERADLVSEMREVKHYYRQGVQARAGIEF